MEIVEIQNCGEATPDYLVERSSGKVNLRTKNLLLWLSGKAVRNQWLRAGQSRNACPLAEHSLSSYNKCEICLKTVFFNKGSFFLVNMH